MDRSFTVQIRNEVFRFIRSLAAKDFETTLSLIEPLGSEESAAWTQSSLAAALEPFFQDHQGVLLDRQARHPQHCRVSPMSSGWQVEQTLIDPLDHNDWRLVFQVNRAKVRETRWSRGWHGPWLPAHLPMGPQQY